MIQAYARVEGLEGSKKVNFPKLKSRLLLNSQREGHRHGDRGTYRCVEVREL